MLNTRVISNIIQLLFHFYTSSNIRKPELPDNFMGIKKLNISVKWVNTAY